MHCPICGQQQISEITRFCSRCGFLLTGVAQVVANKGNVPFLPPDASAKLISPRKRGLKQGVFIFLFGVFLICPVLGLISVALDIEPFLAGMAAILGFCGGILRVIYALFFEEGGRSIVPNQLLPDTAQNFLSSFKRSADQKALPLGSSNFNSANSDVYKAFASQSIPAQGNWRESDTNELMMPSVTEDTTKLLNQQDQK